MSKRDRFMSIKTKMILLFLIAIIIPILIMSINAYISSQQLLTRKYTELLLDIAQQTNIRIEEYLNEIEKISLVTSYGINSYVFAISGENYPVQNFLKSGSKAHEDQATLLLMNYITIKERSISVYIYNLNDGIDLYLSSNKPINYDYDPREESWFVDFIASDEAVMTRSTHWDHQTRSDDNWAISNVRKIFDLNNGDLIGVMVMSFDIDFIHKLNERLQDSQSSTLTIVDDKGIILYNKDYSKIGQSFSDLLHLDTDFSALQHGGQMVTIDQKDHILISNAFEEQQWTTYLYMPVDELSVERDVLLRNLVTMAIALLAFAIIVSIYLSSLITRPIKRLMGNMTLVEKGQFEDLPAVTSNDEIGLLSTRFTTMSKELKQLVERIYKEEEERAEAEIRALQAQINPHFLYNTLNSVKWIASMQRADKIVEMTESLISMLRYSANDTGALVTIEEELNNIKHYVTIQKVRYFNLVDIHFDIDERLLAYNILKLTIQPIVENAIFHGIAEHEDEGEITIRIYEVMDDIIIEVEDSGVGMDDETIRDLEEGRLTAQKHEGIGISNVHHRIQRTFGSKYGITFTSEKGKGTIFYITIPKMIERE